MHHSQFETDPIATVDRLIALVEDDGEEWDGRRRETLALIDQLTARLDSDEPVVMVVAVPNSNPVSTSAVTAQRASWAENMTTVEDDSATAAEPAGNVSDG